MDFNKIREKYQSNTLKSRQKQLCLRSARRSMDPLSQTPHLKIGKRSKESLLPTLRFRRRSKRTINHPSDLMIVSSSMKIIDNSINTKNYSTSRSGMVDCQVQTCPEEEIEPAKVSIELNKRFSNVKIKNLIAHRRNYNRSTKLKLKAAHYPFKNQCISELLNRMRRRMNKSGTGLVKKITLKDPKIASFGTRNDSVSSRNINKINLSINLFQKLKSRRASS
ncbi:unnamed protein product [Moneuplotes crassus]|uniref:Uncharacterized protein n=1 Tax=Euplotes crassus TaxID=5936 RepID=A0AAD2D034_EUPCR|nr:unnamed protein product [Moneuplotes crassus]